MKVYIDHHMDDSEDLCSKLKVAESELAIARKDADEGVKLLRNTEKARDTTKVETH